MGRSPCCEKVGLKKGPWTPEEDQKLVAYIEEHGHGSWRALPANAGLRRCGKSCRLRWTNYLRPDIKRGKFSLQEEQTIIRLHALLGNKWSTIAAHLPKRTDNEIKNYWNTHLKKRLTKMGIDPITHKPTTDASGTGTGTGNSKDTSNLSHMAQWESARLEAEARLTRESRLQLVAQNQLGSTSKPARLILNKISPQPLPPRLDVLKASQRSWSNSQSTKDHPRMHDMYAMMLTVDDLESPTSTLCFPESMPLSISTTTGTFNNNFLPSTTTAPATVDNVGKSSSSCEGNGNAANLGSGFPALKKHKVTNTVQCELINEPYYYSHCITPATTMNMKFFDCKEYGSADSTETSHNQSWKYLPKEAELGEKGAHDRVLGFQDDNIMVAVEAFKAGGGYTSNNVMEACLNDDLLYDSNESLAAAEDSLGIINGEGSNCNTNFEDNNKHYWNSLLNLVSDLPSESPVF